MREKSFSERIGIVEVSTVLQHDSMNDNLRNSLWNVLDRHIWSWERFMREGVNENDFSRFSRSLWFYHFKLPTDELPIRQHLILKQIRSHFFSMSWYKVYDFMEFVLNSFKESDLPNIRHDLNYVLEQELSGFRLIEGKFARITNENEIEEVSEALNSPYSGCQTHLRKALEHMSNRESPDYRNSIKESISAVESVAKEITGNKGATLKDALIQIEKSGKIHGALQSGFVSLYGYTSDADGIRHAMIKDKGANLTFTDAKYFLVTCSAFVNYLIAKHADKHQQNNNE